MAGAPPPPPPPPRVAATEETQQYITEEVDLQAEIKEENSAKGNDVEVESEGAAPVTEDPDAGKDPEEFAEDSPQLQDGRGQQEIKDEADDVW